MTSQKSGSRTVSLLEKKKIIYTVPLPISFSLATFPSVWFKNIFFSCFLHQRQHPVFCFRPCSRGSLLSVWTVRRGPSLGSCSAPGGARASRQDCSAFSNLGNSVPPCAHSSTPGEIRDDDQRAALWLQRVLPLLHSRLTKLKVKGWQQITLTDYFECRLAKSCISCEKLKLFHKVEMKGKKIITHCPTGFKTLCKW